MRAHTACRRLAPLLAAAITLATAHAKQPRSADEQAIRSLEEQERAAVRDGDVAIVMGSERVVPKSASGVAGPPVQRRYTNIWKRSGTTWRAIARNANVATGN